MSGFTPTAWVTTLPASRSNTCTMQKSLRTGWAVPKAATASALFAVTALLLLARSGPASWFQAEKCMLRIAPEAGRAAEQQSEEQLPPPANSGRPAPAAAAAAGEVEEPQQQPPRLLPSCKLEIEKSPFAKSCTLLQNVCVDQGSIILYEPQYLPAAKHGQPRNLPKLDPAPRQAKFQFPYRDESKGKDHTISQPAIHARPASSREARRYLREPAFSNCTVPVVFYGNRPYNFVHEFRDNAAMVFSALRESSWGEAHARIILMTAEGLDLTLMNHQLWQPLSPLRLDTWAEFSDRLRDSEIGRPTPADGSTAGSGAARDGSGGGRSSLLPPPSFEGGEQKCFASMFVCLNDVEPQRFSLHAYGRLLVEYYTNQTAGGTASGTAGAGGQQQAEQEQVQMEKGKGEVEDGEGRDGDGVAASGTAAQQQQQEQQQLLPEEVTRLPPPPPDSILRQLSRQAGKSPGTGAGSKPVLRVVFMKRGGVERQLVNAAELVQRCNKWRHTAPSGARVRAVCWEGPTPTLTAGIALAQAADIFVGVHGANLANGYLMRPGSSLIELTMFGFDDYCIEGDCPHINFAKGNAEDPDTQVQFWKLLLCDRNGSWTPAQREVEARRRGVTSGSDWAKYRNLVVRWEYLETALGTVVDTAGNMSDYRQRWEDGRWRWLTEGTKMVYGPPNMRHACKEGRQQGLL